MATEKIPRNLKDRLIEENLKKAFADKASEDVPAELLNLLEELRKQDQSNGRH